MLLEKTIKTLFASALAAGAIACEGSSNEKEAVGGCPPNAGILLNPSAELGNELDVITIKSGKYSKKAINFEEGFDDVDISPDGEWIVFSRNYGISKGIHKMSIGGDGKTTLVGGNPGGNLGDNFSVEGWSPDGLTILYSTRNWVPDQNKYQYDVFTISQDGTNQQEIPIGPDMFYCMNWLPDSKRISFLSNEGSGDDDSPQQYLYIVNVDGSNFMEIASLPDEAGGDTCPGGWSKDGTYVLLYPAENKWNYGYTLAVITEEGKINILPLKMPNIPAMPAQAQYLLDEDKPAWSPDGKQVMFPAHGYDAIFVVNKDGTNLQRCIEPQDMGMAKLGEENGQGGYFYKTRLIWFK